ncbi:hypothetical protein BHE74_00042477, partial [Ensete ventricosum]
KKEEEEAKENRSLEPSSPAHCRRPRAVATCGSPASPIRPHTARYIPVCGPGGTTKIDRRWLISTVGGRLTEKSTVDGQLKKKKGKEEKKKKEEIPDRHPRLRAARAPSPLAGRPLDLSFALSKLRCMDLHFGLMSPLVDLQLILPITIYNFSRKIWLTNKHKVLATVTGSRCLEKFCYPLHLEKLELTGSRCLMALLIYFCIRTFFYTVLYLYDPVELKQDQKMVGSVTLSPITENRWLLDIRLAHSTPPRRSRPGKLGGDGGDGGGFGYWQPRTQQRQGSPVVPPYTDFDRSYFRAYSDIGIHKEMIQVPVLYPLPPSSFLF